MSDGPPPTPAPDPAGEEALRDSPPPADADDAAPAPDLRRPQSVYGVGTEPDARFTLANERTALAWVRTGLALVAGGVALTSFASLAHLAILVDVIAALACLAGAWIGGYALLAWRRNERALRLRAPLPSPSALPFLVAAVVLLAILLGIYAAWEAWNR